MWELLFTETLVLACLLVDVKKHTWNSSDFSDFLNVNRSLHKHADSAEHLKRTLQLKHLKKNEVQ